MHEFATLKSIEYNVAMTFILIIIIIIIILWRQLHLCYPCIKYKVQCMGEY